MVTKKIILLIFFCIIYDTKINVNIPIQNLEICLRSASINIIWKHIVILVSMFNILFRQ